jgi:hypothetical protein
VPATASSIEKMLIQWRRARFGWRALALGYGWLGWCAFSSIGSGFGADGIGAGGPLKRRGLSVTRWVLMAFLLRGQMQ